MTSFDGLYLKKLQSACSVLGQNIDVSFEPNGELLDALWWSTLRAASRSYQLHLMIFSIFAWLVPMLVPKHNSRFRVFWFRVFAQSADHDDRLTFLKHLVERKAQFPCGMLFLRLAQKQARIWVRCISSILGFRSRNFAQRNTLVYRNRINRHFGFWEKKWKFNYFFYLGNQSSPSCKTEWFHIHVKMAFFHLGVWLIGQGGWNLEVSP